MKRVTHAQRLAAVDAAIERAKRPPRPVRQEGESVKDHRYRVEVWMAEVKRGMN